MYTKKIILILITMFFILALSATSSIALYCKGVKVSIGERTFIVLEKCGKPVYKEIINPGIATGMQKIENWVYGPSFGYYYYLIFKNGKLSKIESIRKYMSE